MLPQRRSAGSVAQFFILNGHDQQAPDDVHPILFRQCLCGGEIAMGPQVWVGREGVVKCLPHPCSPMVGRNDELYLVAITCGHPHNVLTDPGQQVLMAQAGIAQPKEELLR